MRVAVVVAVLACLLAGCSDDRPRGVTLDNRPVAASDIDVDTPELRALKAESGVPDCVPGPGGGQLPELTLPCLGGGTPVDLSSLRGPMLLSFWASWCRECEIEMPALEAFWREHGADVPVLAVDFTDKYPGSALEQLRDRGITYPSLADPGGDVQAFEEFAKIPGMPVLVFVDEDGAIAYVRPGGGIDEQSDVEELVREQLGVDLTTPTSSSPPPLRSSDEQLVGDPGDAL